jgi:tetratricopeptide (TPR) repeat protein
MWIIALLLFLQNANQVPPPQNLPLGGTYRLNGRIVVDKGELPLVDLKLITDNGVVVRTVQSFSNGTFFFNDVVLGRYSVEVVDARFNIATVFLWLREPEDTAKEIVVRLVRGNSSKPAPESAELDKINFTELEMDGRISAAALDEFKKGVEAIRERSKDNPPEAHFTKAIGFAPDFYDAHYQLGLEHSRQRRAAEAIPALERAAALRPSSAAPLGVLGRVYVENGQYQKAVDAVLKSGSIGTLSAEDRYTLGLAFYKLDRTVAAQQQFELAISLAPNKNPAAYVQLHNALVKNGKPAEALTALENYLKLFPNDPNRKIIEENAKKLRATVQKPLRHL